MIRRWLTRLVFVGFVASASPMLTGCDDETTIDEADRDEIFRIFQTGIDQKEDAFVRAETVRVIELLNDPALNRFAEPLLDDSAPMVRVAALRVLLSTQHENARNLGMAAFNTDNDAERRAVLRSALLFGSPPLKRELAARALRTDDELLKEIAFREGELARVRKAIEDKNTKYLERTLMPELVQYLKRDQGVIGALALRQFLELGQDERVEPFLKAFNDERLPVEERVKAGRMLVYARAKAAESGFVKVIEDYDKSIKDESLGIPGKVVPAPLLRVALLGAVAAGNTDYVQRAKTYLQKAKVEESLEVLEALAANPSDDAAIALKIAMQDARDDVRTRAIALYEVREDATADALTGAMRGAPYGTQRRLSQVLMERYPDEWIAILKTYLQRSSELDFSLRLLRDVIVSQQEANLILKPLQEELQAVLKNEKPERKALAAYLIAIANGTPGKGDKALDEQFDDETRYAFLEFMVRENPAPHVMLFRKYFNADNFAVRLMCAAGLWRVASANTQTAPAEAPATEEADEIDSSK